LRNVALISFLSNTFFPPRRDVTFRTEKRFLFKNERRHLPPEHNEANVVVVALISVDDEAEATMREDCCRAGVRGQQNVLKERVETTETSTQ
jgi:hypothetical protein